MSAVNLLAPNKECLESSILIVSLMPFRKYLCFLDISYLLTISINGSRFGLSPYTLLVDKYANFAPDEYFLIFSKMLSVPSAFIVKSVKGSLAAQS